MKPVQPETEALQEFTHAYRTASGQLTAACERAEHAYEEATKAYFRAKGQAVKKFHEAVLAADKAYHESGAEPIEQVEEQTT